MKVFMLRNIDTGSYYKRPCHWVSKTCATVWTDRKGPYSARGALTKLSHASFTQHPAPMTEIVEMTILDELGLDLVLFALRDTAVQQEELGGDGADFRDLAKRLA